MRLLTLFALGALAAAPAWSEPAQKHCDHAAPAKPSSQRYDRSTGHYPLPDVTLIDQDGRSISLAKILSSDRPVAVNFIFTTCTTICPVMTATFRGLEQKLSKDKEIQLVSISIDPEHDRPTELRAYADRFHAGPNWNFYTGSSADVRAVLNAFGVFNGDKANHRPITLLRRAHDEAWTRIEGFPSASQLAGEYHALVAAN